MVTASEEHGGQDAGIVAYLADAANLVTLSGLAASGLGVWAVLRGDLLVAAALGLVAVLADTLDGIVARRSRRRPPRGAAYGVQLDSLADVVMGGVLPASILMAMVSPPWGLVGVALLVMAASRLAHFNVYAAAGGETRGMAVVYNPPAVAGVLLATQGGSAPGAGAAMAIVVVALAVLNVAPVRTPELRGWVLAAFVCVTLILLAGLVTTYAG